MWTNAEMNATGDRLSVEVTRRDINAAVTTLTIAAGIIGLTTLSVATAPGALVLGIAAGVGGVSAAGLLSAAAILNSVNDGSLSDEKAYRAAVDAADAVLKYSDPISSVSPLAGDLIILKELSEFERTPRTKTEKAIKIIKTIEEIAKKSIEEEHKTFLEEEVFQDRYNQPQMPSNIPIHGEFGGNNSGSDKLGKVGEADRNNMNTGQSNGGSVPGGVEGVDWIDKAERRSTIS